MSLRPLLLALALIPVATSAHAGARLSPRVRMVAHGALAPRAISAPLHPDDRASVTVRIEGGAAALQAAGFAARPLAGDVASLQASAADLRRLARLAGVVQVEERRLLHPLLDQAAPAIFAPQARAATGLDGRGVVVGVVDTGIDFRHDDFRTDAGHTRVKALLDYSLGFQGRHQDLSSYGGAVWLQNEIDAQLNAEAAHMSPAVVVTERDTNGHGTHVAGIAAGNGLATGRGLPAGRYVGVAPAADLVVVQATRGGDMFTEDDVVSGCRFVFDRASALGEPAVVNLSLGGSGGGHDGSSNLEEALDALVGPDYPGRAIVVAAGNDGLDDQHAGGWALAGSQSTGLAVPSSQQADSQVAIELWYSGQLTIALTSPSGTHYGPVATGSPFDSGLGPGGHILIDNASAGPEADGRESAGIVLLGPTGAAPEPGSWTLEVNGRAERWDAWVIDSPSDTPGAQFTDRIDEDDRLTLPASARELISVGSFVSRASWTNIDGKLIRAAVTVGAPSTFSATGPTADGRFAPDVAAPGEYVLSALSADAPPSSPDSVFYAGADLPAWGDDGVHAALRGTSQAAPFAAGTTALLLEANPRLDSRQLRELLRATARDAGAGFSPRLGFGKLDALTALRGALSKWGQTLDPARSSVGVSRDALPPGEETTTVTVTPRDADGMPLGPGHRVTISASAGAPMGDVVDLGEGRYEQTWVAHAARGQVATITATVDGAELAAHPRIFFVNDRAEIGRAFVAAGGCSTSTGATSGWLALVFLGTALLWRRHRGRATLRR